jgi:hypothetical protein
MTVIEVVPFIVSHRLAESSVMSEPNVTKMVGDGKAVVDQFVLLTLLSTKDEVTHIKTIQREVDLGLKLGSTYSETIFTLSSLKSFESDNQNWRSAVNLKSLVSGDMVLTVAAVPLIVFVQCLSHSEFLEAVNKTDVSFRCLKFVYLGPSVSRSEAVEELRINSVMPDNFKLDVLALDISIVDIQRVIGLKINHVHEALHGHVVRESKGAVITLPLFTVKTFVVISGHIHESDIVGHVSDINDIFVLFFGFTANQAREAHVKLFFNSQGVEISSGEGFAFFPAKRFVREGRKIFT